MIENRTGYLTEDLARFAHRGCDATGIRPDRVVFVASPIRTRGCADVPSCSGATRRGGRLGRGATVVVAVASPSRITARRLARVYEHELLHASCLEHRDMTERDMYSRGPAPTWARGLRLRWRGRAPRQL